MYLVEVIILLADVPVCDVIPDVVLTLPEPAAGLGVQRPRGGVRHPGCGHEPCLHPDILKTFKVLTPKSNPQEFGLRQPL